MSPHLFYIVNSINIVLITEKEQEILKKTAVYTNY